MISFLAFTIAQQTASAKPIDLNGVLVNPRNLLVKVIDPVAKGRLKHESRFTFVKEIPRINYVVVRVPEGKLQATKAMLQRERGVEAVEFDRVAKLTEIPNDPEFPNQWSLPAMHVPEAWDISKGSTPIVVADIDSGVDMTHPDLENNLWTNPGEIPNNGIDDDGNGYVDDVHGYDFANDDSDPTDDNGHGTITSSVIAATHNNGIGMTGVAPMARIMCVKAGLWSGDIFESALLPAYIYSADNGAKIFSCSFGSDNVSVAERDAIRYAVSKGVLPVASAGNSGSVLPHYPAAYDEVLSVAAVAEFGATVQKASFSNYGCWVDVSAPGKTVLAIYWFGYGFASGTSLSCPNVSGTAALLWSAKPTATAEQIRSAIEDTATTMNEPPFGEISNYGFVNAEAALRAIVGKPAPRKEAAVRYMSPVGGEPPSNKSRIMARIMGRGFEKDAKVELRKGTRRLPILGRGRNYIDFYNVDGIDPIDVIVDKKLAESIPQPAGHGYEFPLLEASNPGNSIVGSFPKAVAIDDSFVEIHPSAGFISLEGTFGRVIPSGTMHLKITRRYTGSFRGFEYETISLLDWSIGYGVYRVINNQAFPSGMLTTTIDIPDFDRFVDPEGRVYVRLESTVVDPSVTAHLDQLVLTRDGP